MEPLAQSMKPSLFEVGTIPPTPTPNSGTPQNGFATAFSSSKPPEIVLPSFTNDSFFEFQWAEEQLAAKRTQIRLLQNNNTALEKSLAISCRNNKVADNQLKRSEKKVMKQQFKIHKLKTDKIILKKKISMIKNLVAKNSDLLEEIEKILE